MTQPVPHFNVSTTEFAPLPPFGSHAILYKSEDGTRVAGSFREAGTHSMVLPFDEFIYVVNGSCSIAVEGHDSFELSVGECTYLREGWNVTFSMSDDFQDVAVLSSNTPFDLDAPD